jgi:hypothetical protein
MIITGLMAELQGFGSEPWGRLKPSDITKKLLAGHIKRITPHALLHGQVTMCDSGPWS